ncbi:MAG: hypothetical protein M3R54_05105 [Chloroflexota bacterium]|nr:hypothetical protein [Chloroflexota bacterium]
MRIFQQRGLTFQLLPRHIAAVVAAAACAVAGRDIWNWTFDPTEAVSSTSSLRPFVAITTLAVAGGIALLGVRPSWRRLGLSVAGIGTLLAAAGVVMALVNGDVTPRLVDLVSAGHPDHIDVNVSALLLLAGLSVLASARPVLGKWTPQLVAAAAGLIAKALPPDELVAWLGALDAPQRPLMAA